ncbi:MAG: hypothetical protein ABF289_12360 [Clostridiales bacterium]
MKMKIIVIIVTLVSLLISLGLLSNKRAIANPTYGQNIVNQIFKVDKEGKKVFDETDRKMLIDMMTLFISLDDSSNFKNLYQRVFEKLLFDNKNETGSLKTGIKTVNGFINFIQNNTYKFDLKKMEEYLVENDSAAFADLIDMREVEFKKEMIKAGNDIKNIDENLKYLSMLYKIFQKSDTFHTEFYIYNTNTNRMNLDENKVKVIVDNLGEELGIINKDTKDIVEGLNEIVEYCNNTKNKRDKILIIKYFNEYGMVKIIPVPTETSTSTSTNTASKSAKKSTKTPSPNKKNNTDKKKLQTENIKIENTKNDEKKEEIILAEPFDFNVDIVKDNNKVIGTLDVDNWNELKEKVNSNKLITFLTITEDTGVLSSTFNIPCSVYYEICSNKYIEEFIISTDNGVIKVNKKVIKKYVDDFLDNEDEKIKSTAVISFIFREYSDKGLMDYSFDIALNKINNNGTTVMEELSGNNLFNSIIEIY